VKDQVMENSVISTLPELPVESREFAADPFTFCAAARRSHPWLARFSQGYVVHGYQACADMFADARNLTCGFGPIIDFYGVRGTMWARFMEEIMISANGAAHQKMRACVASAFTPLRANRERATMQHVITTLLDEWSPRGEIDFAEFASYFPVTVMCGVLGVSPERIPPIRDALENQLKSIAMDLSVKPLFMAGWEVLWDFADSVVKEREPRAGSDGDVLLDMLIAARNAGEIDETELRFHILNVAVAGYDTSKNQLAMTMKLLLDRPEVYRRCAGDLAYCRKVVEEALRYSSIASPVRVVVNDFAYDGHQFHKGEMLVIAAPLANRDPLAFEDPDRFDPDRANAGRNVAFGRGSHMCIGQHQARNQLQEGLHLIAQRLTNPRLVGPVEWRPFLGAWGPRTLPIAFDAV
jgi:cytochrome P450